VFSKERKFRPIATVNKFMLCTNRFNHPIATAKNSGAEHSSHASFPIKKTIVHFSLGKTILSFFNLVHGFFF
jgi:hypothetical protein